MLCDVCSVVRYLVNWFVVRGCVVLWRHIHVYNSDVFSAIIMYLDHLKFCVVCIIARRSVCCSQCYVVSNKCDEPIPCTLGVLALGVSLVT